jgi:site-specific DNA-cytosine methylase
MALAQAACAAINTAVSDDAAVDAAAAVAGSSYVKLHLAMCAVAGTVLEGVAFNRVFRSFVGRKQDVQLPRWWYEAHTEDFVEPLFLLEHADEIAAARNTVTRMLGRVGQAVRRRADAATLAAAAAGKQARAAAPAAAAGQAEAGGGGGDEEMDGDGGDASRPHRLLKAPVVFDPCPAPAPAAKKQRTVGPRSAAAAAGVGAARADDDDDEAAAPADAFTATRRGLLVALTADEAKRLDERLVDPVAIDELLGTLKALARPAPALDYVENLPPHIDARLWAGLAREMSAASFAALGARLPESQRAAFLTTPRAAGAGEPLARAPRPPAATLRLLPLAATLAPPPPPEVGQRGNALVFMGPQPTAAAARAAASAASGAALLAARAAHAPLAGHCLLVAAAALQPPLHAPRVRAVAPPPDCAARGAAAATAAGNSAAQFVFDPATGRTWCERFVVAGERVGLGDFVRVGAADAERAVAGDINNLAGFGVAGERGVRGFAARDVLGRGPAPGIGARAALYAARRLGAPRAPAAAEVAAAAALRAACAAGTVDALGAAGAEDVFWAAAGTRAHSFDGALARAGATCVCEIVAIFYCAAAADFFVHVRQAAAAQTTFLGAAAAPAALLGVGACATLPARAAVARVAVDRRDARARYKNEAAWRADAPRATAAAAAAAAAGRYDGTGVGDLEFLGAHSLEKGDIYLDACEAPALPRIVTYDTPSGALVGAAPWCVCCAAVRRDTAAREPCMVGGGAPGGGGGGGIDFGGGGGVVAGGGGAGAFVPAPRGALIIFGGQVLAAGLAVTLAAPPAGRAHFCRPDPLKVALDEAAAYRRAAAAARGGAPGGGGAAVDGEEQGGAGGGGGAAAAAGTDAAESGGSDSEGDSGVDESRGAAIPAPPLDLALVAAVGWLGGEPALLLSPLLQPAVDVPLREPPPHSLLERYATTDADAYVLARADFSCIRRVVAAALLGAGAEMPAARPGAPLTRVFVTRGADVCGRAQGTAAAPPATQSEAAALAACRRCSAATCDGVRAGAGFCEPLDVGHAAFALARRELAAGVPDGDASEHMQLPAAAAAALRAAGDFLPWPADVTVCARGAETPPPQPFFGRFACSGGGPLALAMHAAGVVFAGDAFDVDPSAAATHALNAKWCRSENIEWAAAVGHGGKFEDARGAAFGATGPPCAGWSAMAKAQKQTEATRARLEASQATFLVHISDLLAARPAVHFTENVTGLLGSSFFRVGIEALAREGQQSTFFRYILAASGVRQTRVRIAWLLVSSWRALPAAPLPLFSTAPRGAARGGEARSLPDVFSNGWLFNAAPELRGARAPFGAARVVDVLGALPAAGAGSVAYAAGAVTAEERVRRSAGGVVSDHEVRAVSPELAGIIALLPRFASACGTDLPPGTVVPPSWHRRRIQDIISRIMRDGLARTLVALGAHVGGFQGPQLHWLEDRLLSLREHCRLAGLGDNFRLVGREDEAVAILGHCVPFDFGAAVGYAILESMRRAE